MLTPTKPRYAEVADTLAAEIETGVYPVGAELPGEHQLCHRFEVSRYTIRGALSQLEAAGLIARRKGAATTVIATTPPLRHMASMSSEAEILRYAAEHALVLDGGPKPTSGLTARRLDLGPREDWVTVQGVRRSDDPLEAPIGDVTVLLRQAYAGVIDEFNDGCPALYTRVAERFGLEIVRIDQQFTAKALSGREARRLDAEPGSPGLVVVRRYWAGDPGGGDPSMFEVSVNVHPPDRFYYSMTMERPRG